jgi:transglutaminase-like putative cysteine protease
VRISVTHQTVYRYSIAVHLEPHTFRLRPRQDASQRLLQHALSISPAPAGQAECLDQDGNVIVEAWFDQPVEALSVQSAFTVETLRENPFDFLLRDYSAPVRAALAPYLCEPATEVREFAASIARGASHTLDFLTALNRCLAQEFSYVVRETGAPHAADLTLRTRQGSCRDLAVLFCGAARSMGIAARFVSGYECAAIREGKLNTHAWAEVYLEGGGWRGYDPSSGLAVSTAHIALAAAGDPQLAAPVSGTFRGAADARMEFAIAISKADV